MENIVQLRNDVLQVAIATKGAELQSIYNKNTGIEYLWQGDANFWGKRSPVLFPIVGGLKNNQYTFKGNTYQLPRHGFARDMYFEAELLSPTEAKFVLKSNEETLANYPFNFLFSTTYRLQNNSVIISYEVKNEGSEIMFFSVGAHPAFNVPLGSNEEFSDYYLQFSEEENAGIFPLNNEGLLLKEPVLFFKEESGKIQLDKTLFYKDALVFKTLRSEAISIVSIKNNNGLTVAYEGFPYMGIWSAKDANFVCIEPWCGIADSIDSIGELSRKEGIYSLSTAEIFTRSWQVSCF